jgi:uncharacterized protein
MILEGIITTTSSTGAIHIAPMGPDVEPSFERLLFRPYRTSQSYQNLLKHGEGVLHVTDDVLLLAQAAVGRVESFPEHIPAARVKGFVLTDSCRYFEFRVRSIDDREDRVRIDAEVVHSKTLRDFFGFNRAKHAVVEAAILATRTEFLPLSGILEDYGKLATLVEKTGGPKEKEAFRFLRTYLDEVMQRRSPELLEGER